MSAARLLFLFLLLIAQAALGETLPWVQPEDVRFERLAEGFRVEIEMLAPVPLAIAWKVLTDFNQMGRFVPNVESSRIVSAQGDVLKIEQTGRVRFWPLSQRFESVREITLRGGTSEILARQLTGTARRMESRMRLKAIENGNTRLEYRAEIVPDGPLPPLLGPAVVRHETAEQFSAMIAEMVRRQGTLPTPAAAIAPPASPVPPPGSKGS